MPETMSRLPVQESSERYEPLRAQRDPLAEGSGRIRSDRSDRDRWRKQTWLGRFISTYGWRAYAIPLLVALTVFVGYQTVTQREPAHAGTGPNEPVADPPSIGALGDAIIGAPPKGLTQFDATLPTGVLPEGESFTEAGAKSWHVVPGTTPQIGTGAAKVFAYTIEVEDGIDTMGFGGDDLFARMVTETLASQKSWTHNPQFGFVRIDSGTPDFRISLTSPATVREGCGYEIQLEASCYNPRYGENGDRRVFINEARWVRGAVPFQGDITSYRQYVINHEVGHAIGYRVHEPCEQDQQLAPVMMQQTFSTNNNDAAKFDADSIKPDGKTCRTNPWPYPIP
ncbi:MULTISPECIES: DUF3152 domain-containing protein [unclassified Mycobacterium]|uniref:DUF3152 domain-containing protein n=1 Tax=unclassified Mycobacterium TaxID=2642494 RepID=UPI00099229AC|nr:MULTISPECIES: DUF3152 domain-containing protein [unclassified Mycobacterium]